MREAIISDIHGNLEALIAVLDDIKRRNVDRIVCLGDIVGYGANPIECAEMVSLSCNFAIKGNHEISSLRRGLTTEFTFNGVRLKYENRGTTLASDSFTNGLLVSNSAIFGYLQSLPTIVVEGDNSYVHGCPIEGMHPEVYIDDEDISRLLNLVGADMPFFLYHLFNSFGRLCFVGHTHTAAVTFMHEGKLHTRKPFYSTVSEVRQELNRGKQFIINVGSVGQPRDNDPRACYAVYDSNTNMVEFYRVVYDIDAAQAKILGAGLPGKFATRLTRGE